MITVMPGHVYFVNGNTNGFHNGIRNSTGIARNGNHQTVMNLIVAVVQ